MRQDFAFERAVLRALRTESALAPGSRLLVAVSGGVDSTALLLVLDALCRRGDLAATLAVAHFDHRLREESARDADVVRDLAQKLGVPCFVGEGDALAAGRGNREARARAARYAFLEQTARAFAADHVCVAHTRDDQAETVLLRLARGAGPASLGAMTAARDDGLLRPLLELPRSACVAYVEARGFGWVEDASNADETLFRNRVRRRVLPALEAGLGVDVRARLARLAEQLRQESSLAEQRITQLLGDGPGGALALAAVHAAGAGAPRLLHAWLARAGLRPSTRQVEQLLAVARGERPSATLDLGGGVRVERRYDVLQLMLQPAPQLPENQAARLEIPGDARIAGWRVRSALTEVDAAAPAALARAASAAWLDVDLLDAPLALRPPAAGDRVRLVYGRRKLADILIDARVPRQERRSLAVVASGDDIVWVPGVVRSTVAVAGPASRRLARLDAERVATIVPGVE